MTTRPSSWFEKHEAWFAAMVTPAAMALIYFGGVREKLNGAVETGKETSSKVEKVQIEVAEIHGWVNAQQINPTPRPQSGYAQTK